MRSFYDSHLHIRWARFGGLSKSPEGVIIGRAIAAAGRGQDMVAGTFRLPWEDQVKITDGTSCGFPVPTRVFGAKAAKAAE